MNSTPHIRRQQLLAQAPAPDVMWATQVEPLGSAKPNGLALPTGWRGLWQRQLSQTLEMLDAVRFAARVHRIEHPDGAQRIKFWLRTVRDRMWALRWYRTLYREQLQSLPANPATHLSRRRSRLTQACEAVTVARLAPLVGLIQRSFYDHRLSAKERFELLCTHRALIAQRLSRWSIRKIEQGGQVLLASVAGKTHEYRLVLTASTGWREGLLTLQLLMDDAALVNAVFSVSRWHDITLLRVGTIQSTHDQPKEKLKAATKDLHGIQPRVMLLNALRWWAARLGVTELEGIATTHHPFMAGHFARKALLKIEFESLWRQLGGVLNERGNYRLPLTRRVKALTEYPSHKRAQMRRQQLIWEVLEAQLAAKVPVPSDTQVRQAYVGNS
jgi:uncharacterized protein